ncbi:Endo-1,4-beta-xylanase C, partial [Striga asiatica]
MAKFLNLFLLSIYIRSILLGFHAHALKPYDHFFTDECLIHPLKPQYEGGKIVNPELNEGLFGWEAFGDAKIEHMESTDGINKYIGVFGRNKTFHSFKQTVYLEKEKLYTVSAWVQLKGHSRADVAVMVKTSTGFEIGGWVLAKSGCWSMLKGGFTVNVSGPAELYFESKNLQADIFADSISLQPFTLQEWKSHQRYNVEKVRKSGVKFNVLDQWGRPVRNATVRVTQKHRLFPFGCAMNKNILDNLAYQKWFLPRFKYTVFENELKWYSTEYFPNNPDYSISDKLVQFAKSNRIKIRGHNVFWDVPDDQPSWVKGLPPYALWGAANRRIESVMNRYKGQVIQWDVVNENMHGQYFENNLGSGASCDFYKIAHQIDGTAIPFLNDYNTIEQCWDPYASPWKYLQKIKELRSCIRKMGIGLEGHFTSLNLPYLRSALDAYFLEQILREIHSHPKVKGIMLWAAISPSGCYQMCLTDYNNFRNLPTGDVVDNFISNLTHAADLPGSTDSNGIYKTRLYHGQYEVIVNHPNGRSTSFQMDVLPRRDKRGGHAFSIYIKQNGKGNTDVEEKKQHIRKKCIMVKKLASQPIIPGFYKNPGGLAAWLVPHGMVEGGITARKSWHGMENFGHLAKVLEQ